MKLFTNILQKVTEKRYVNERKIFFLGTLLTIMAGLLGGCANHKEENTEQQSDYIIGVVAKSESSEYWMSVRSGMEAAAEAVGARVIFFAPNTEENAEMQEKMAQALVRRDVAVLAISPINASQSKNYIETAEEKGIPVIAFDSAFEDSEIPYIGIDNKEAGYKMAKYLAEKLDHEGEIGIISGELNQLCHYQRVEGIKNYISTEPNMKISYIESGYSGGKMSGAKITELKEQYPAVKGVVVTSAVTAMGIVEGGAMGNLKITSIDVQEDALSALKNRRIQGLVAQSGYDIGYETIFYADAILRGDENRDDKILPAEFLTPENVEAYIEKYTQ